jgi:hypothetical protein
MADYTDDFNRASLGGNWTIMGGNFTIEESTWVEPHCPTDIGGCRYSAGTFANDQYSEITVKGVLAFQGIGPLVRANGAANNFYCAYSNSGTTAIRKITSGSSSQLATTSATLAAGDVLRIEVTGSSPAALVVKINGTSVLTYDDSSSPFTSGEAGMSGYGESFSQGIDAWAGGDIGGAAASGKGYNYYGQL